MTRPMQRLVETLIESEDWAAIDLATLAEDAASLTLERLELDPADYEISLLACDDARIAELNAEFRDKPQPTNVLSWPSADLAAEEPGEMPELGAAWPELGDIAITWGVCTREAAEAGRPLEWHLRHLIVHGVLHLLGFDHIDDKDAALMEALEAEILAVMGIPDPYSETGQGGTE